MKVLLVSMGSPEQNQTENRSPLRRNTRRESDIFYPHAESETPMQHVAITKNIEPVKREEMLRTLEPWALIKLTEVITTYNLQNNTVAKIAQFIAPTALKEMAKKIRRANVEEFKAYEEKDIAEASDILFKKLFSIVIRPITTREYVILWINNLQELRAVDKNWEMTTRDYDIQLFGNVVEFLRKARGLYDLIHQDVPENVSAKWPMKYWGKGEDIGLLKIVHGQLGKYAKKFTTLMGGETSLKELKQGKEAVESYFKLLEAANQKMCGYAVEEKRREAEHQEAINLREIQNMVKDLKQAKREENKNNFIKSVERDMDDEADHMEYEREGFSESEEYSIRAMTTTPFKRPDFRQGTNPTILKRGDNSPGLKRSATDTGEALGPCFAEFKKGCPDKANCKYNHSDQAMEQLMYSEVRRIALSKYCTKPKLQDAVIRAYMGIPESSQRLMETKNSHIRTIEETTTIEDDFEEKPLLEQLTNL